MMKPARKKSIAAPLTSPLACKIEDQDEHADTYEHLSAPWLRVIDLAEVPLIRGPLVVCGTNR